MMVARGHVLSIAAGLANLEDREIEVRHLLQAIAMLDPELVRLSGMQLSQDPPLPLTSPSRVRLAPPIERFVNDLDVPPNELSTEMLLLRLAQHESTRQTWAGAVTLGELEPRIRFVAEEHRGKEPDQERMGRFMSQLRLFSVLLTTRKKFVPPVSP